MIERGRAERNAGGVECADFAGATGDTNAAAIKLGAVTATGGKFFVFKGFDDYAVLKLALNAAGD